MYGKNSGGLGMRHRMRNMTLVKIKSLWKLTENKGRNGSREGKEDIGML